jgi:protein-tyrosine phosphatase
MVDIHCHLLPEVDDGAKTWDIAVEMCRMAAQDGIEHIVATPHANSEFRYNREEHEQRLQRLRELAPGTVELSLGCDFHMSYENIQDALQHPGRYCIADSSYLLVEFSDFSIPPNVDDLLTGFLDRGITPVVTHPERNPIMQRHPEIVIGWARAGAVIQCTANSMTGRWGPSARKMIEHLVKNDAIHVLASDAHGLNSRPPVLSEARKAMAKLAGDEIAEALVNTNPRAIVTSKRSQ